jgi:predicted DNA-binding transcriptional regulator AlpA
MASQSRAGQTSDADPDARASEIWSPQHTARQTSLSIATIWRLRQTGAFPNPIKLSPGRVGFRRLDVEAWLAGRAGQRITDPLRPSPKRRRVA